MPECHHNPKFEKEMTKSKCQRRLDQRCHEQMNNVPLSEDTLQMRLAQAQAKRLAQTSKRQQLASARIHHVHQVVRQQQQQRSQQFGLLCHRLDQAAQKRHAQLSQRQLVCRQQLQRIDQRVQSLKQSQCCQRQQQRDALEQQLCRAEQRRTMHQQQLRQRLSQRRQTVEQVKDRLQSAKILQQWFRQWRRTHHASQTLCNKSDQVQTIATCWSSIATSTFEQSMLLLQQRHVTKAAQELLQVLQPSRPRRSKVATRQRSNAFRVFLMAGMIASHPNEIMQEQPSDILVFAARALKNKLMRVLDAMNGLEMRLLKLKRAGKELRILFEYFVECFNHWKRVDAERLASEMLGSYQQIFVTKVHYELADADHQGDGVHQLLEQTEKQLSQLRSALSRVIGNDDSHRRIQALERKVRGQMMPELPQPEEEVTGSSSSDAEPEDSEDFVKQTALSMTSSQFLENEKLVHELILNPEYQFPVDNRTEYLPSRTTAEQIRTTMRRAFWDHLAQSNDWAALVAQFDEFSQAFGAVLGDKCQSLVKDVQQALDARALSEILTGTDAADIVSKTQWRLTRVLECIVLSEAPARNESTRAYMARLDTISASSQLNFQVFVEFLSFVYRKLDELRVDLANFHLSLLATHLKHHGVDYEQRKLAEKLASGTMRLSHTRKWLAKSLKAMWPGLKDTHQARLLAHDAEMFSRLLRVGFLSLVEVDAQDFGRSDADCAWPESFALDIDRIRSIRNVLDKVVLISCILALLQEYSTRRHLGTTHASFGQINSRLMTLLDAQDLSGVDLIAQVVEEAKRLEPEEARAKTTFDLQQLSELEARAKDVLLNDQNVLFRLFRSRVYATLSAVVFGEKEVTSSVHPSLRAYESVLRDQWRVALRLVRHNEVVYATHYNRLIKELVVDLKE